MAIVFPPPEKHTILRLANEGTLCPPNTTRHIIPARPVGADIPLELLELDIGEANRQLSATIGDPSSAIYHPPGSSYEGREYEEALLEIRNEPHTPDE